ncbi:hypothetical protein CKY51_04435 [Xanthomonas maliensis]|nr:hypothetical protein CKY51_04435 [Xanthomonas maliensis]
MVALTVSACASDSGVVQTGKDTYIITKQAATGFSGLGNLKSDAMREAYAQCSKNGKSVQVVDSQETKPPYLLGNYPRVDITFRCVAD